MKKLAVILMAVGLFGAMPVLAAEKSAVESVRQCALQAESIQEKINRLQAEVNAGKKTHNKEDIQKLEKQLKEASDLLEYMNSNN